MRPAYFEHGLRNVQSGEHALKGSPSSLNSWFLQAFRAWPRAGMLVTRPTKQVSGLIRALVIVSLPALSGCATNYVHPEFSKRMCGVNKYTLLLAHSEAFGLTHGGLKKERLPEDAAGIMQSVKSELSSGSALQSLDPVPVVYTPTELSKLGYSEEESARDVELLTHLLKTAMSSPSHSARGEELEAVRRLAVRGSTAIIGLGFIRSERFASEQAKRGAVVMAILMSAAGYYGAPPYSKITSQWVMIDPSDGSVLRTLEKTFTGPSPLR